MELLHTLVHSVMGMEVSRVPGTMLRRGHSALNTSLGPCPCEALSGGVNVVHFSWSPACSSHPNSTASTLALGLQGVALISCLAGGSG